MYNVVLVLLLIVPILIVVDAVGDTLVILLLFLIAWVATFTLGIMFAPKLVPFIISPQSLTSPIGRRRTASSDAQDFSFLSLNQIPTSAALQPYLLALDKHSGECKRLMERLQQKERLSLPSAPNPAIARAAVEPAVAAFSQLPGQLRTSASDKGGQMLQLHERSSVPDQQVMVRGASVVAITPDEVRLDGEAEVVVVGRVEAAVQKEPEEVMISMEGEKHAGEDRRVPEDVDRRVLN